MITKEERFGKLLLEAVREENPNKVRYLERIVENAYKEKPEELRNYMNLNNQYVSGMAASAYYQITKDPSLIYKTIYGGIGARVENTNLFDNKTFENLKFNYSKNKNSFNNVTINNGFNYSENENSFYNSKIKSGFYNSKNKHSFYNSKIDYKTFLNSSNIDSFKDSIIENTPKKSLNLDIKRYHKPSIFKKLVLKF